MGTAITYALFEEGNFTVYGLICGRHWWKRIATAFIYLYDEDFSFTCRFIDDDKMYFRVPRNVSVPSKKKLIKNLWTFKLHYQIINHINLTNYHILQSQTEISEVEPIIPLLILERKRVKILVRVHVEAC